MRKWNIFRAIAVLLSLFLAVGLLAPVASASIIAKQQPVVNTFVPGGEESGGLLVHKKVEHPYGEDYALPSGLKFDFKITLGSYYANARIHTTAGTLKADGEGAIAVSVQPGTAFGIQQLRPGDTVRVTERLQEGSGFTVKGEATQSVIIPAIGNAEVTFTNTYAPAAVHPAGVTLKGEKKLVGRDWQEGDAFTVLLERQTSAGWEPMATRTLKKGSAIFDFTAELQAGVYTAPGSYNYRLTEQKGSAEGITYDATVYPLCLTVTDRDMDGKLELSNVTAGYDTLQKGEGTYRIFIPFENVYTAPDQAGKPEQSVKPEQPPKPGVPSPNTGESFEFWPWLAVFIFSSGALSVLLLLRKKHKEKH